MIYSKGSHSSQFKFMGSDAVLIQVQSENKSGENVEIPTPQTITRWESSGMS